MPVVYVKDGKEYIYNPINFLNDDRLHQGQNRGDKLQEFFNQQGIDFDLGSGTGRDKENFYYFTFDRFNHVTGARKAFSGTDYLKSSVIRSSQMNMNANDNFRAGLKSSALTSSILYLKPGNSSPQILYFDDNNMPALSEPFNRLDLERMKPKEPGWFAKLAHRLNGNWYKKEFDNYDRKTELYRLFTREFDAMSENAKNLVNDRKIETTAESYAETTEQMNKRIDAFLGPDAHGIQEFVDKKIYKPESFPAVPLDYPKNNPFSDHEIAVIGFSMLSDPGIAVMFQEHKFLNPEETMKYNYTHICHDIFLASPRQNSDRSVRIYNPARQKALGYVKAYMEGNKDPLAKALGGAVRQQLANVNSMEFPGARGIALNNATKQVFGILQKDPDLMAKSGLSQDEIVHAKGRIREAEIYRNYLNAQNELQQAVRGETEIDNQRKEELLSDIFLGKYIRSVSIRDMNEYIAKTEEVAVQTMKLTEAQMAKTKADNAVKNAPKDSPDLQELKEKAADAQEKVGAETAKIDILFAKRPVTSVLKLLGNDDDGKTAEKGLIERIRATETFKTYLNKSIDELGAIQRKTSDDKTELDSKIPQMISQLVPPVEKENIGDAVGNGVKVDVKEAEKENEKAEEAEAVNEMGAVD